jgi:excisionase family DNA binding protein
VQGAGVVITEASSAPSHPEILTLEQVAEMLGVNYKTALYSAQRGDLPGRRVGKRWVFSRAAVLAWLACK